MTAPKILNDSFTKSSWPVQIVKDAGSSIYALGGKTAHLIGLSDLRMGAEEIYLGEYKSGLGYLAKGSLRLGLTAAAIYTTYKVVNYTIDFVERQPVNHEVEVGTCSESSILTKKWNSVTCDEYTNDPELKSFIDRPEIYKGKSYVGDRLDLKRNLYGELLVPVNGGGYEKWSTLREIEKTVGLVTTKTGFAPFGSPFSVEANANALNPGYYLDVNTRYDFFPHPHNAIRLREVTGSDITTHSFGFYPKARSFFTMFTSIILPTEGVVTGQDPFEFDIEDTTGISQTTFNVTKEKFEEIKKFVTEYKGYYSAGNTLASSCKGFTSQVLSLIGEDKFNFLWFWPGSLGSSLAKDTRGHLPGVITHLFDAKSIQL